MLQFLHNETQPTMAELLHQSEKLISPITGLIKGLHFECMDNGDPEIFLAASGIGDTRLFNTFGTLKKFGAAGLKFAETYMAAVGETLERYCPGFYDENEFLFGTYRDFSDTAIHPECFALFSDRQYTIPGFHYSRFTEETKVQWTNALSLTRGCEVLVPASSVYIPYRPRKDEGMISYQTTNGLACHGSYTQAVLTALYEVIERDAFSITWLNRLPVPLITLNNGAETPLFSEAYAEVFCREGLVYKAFDVTLDIPVPTSFTLVTGQSSCGHIMAMGSATRFLMSHSLLKSFLEASHSRHYAQFLLRANTAWMPADDFSNITDFDKHILLYNKRPDLRSVISYLFAEEQEGYPTRPLRQHCAGLPSDVNPELQLESVVAKLAELDLEVIVVDVTTDDVRDAGFVVVRVLIPELIPLTGNHNFPFLGGRRLYSVPVRLGYRETEPSDVEFFMHPHPSA